MRGSVQSNRSLLYTCRSLGEGNNNTRSS